MKLKSEQDLHVSAVTLTGTLTLYKHDDVDASGQSCLTPRYRLSVTRYPLSTSHGHGGISSFCCGICDHHFPELGRRHAQYNDEWVVIIEHALPDVPGKKKREEIRRGKWGRPNNECHSVS